MNENLEKLLLYFKENPNDTHSEYANDLIKDFISNMDAKQKKRIDNIVLLYRKKNTEYYKNYSIELFIRSYVFNKNNGRKIGTLEDNIKHFEKLLQKSID